MSKTIIPVGYRLSVVSWENDGDHYNTEVMEGLSEEEVKFLVEICKLHYSQYRDHNVRTFGNMYEPNDKEIEEYYEALDNIRKKYPNVKDKYDNEEHELEDGEHVREAFCYDLGFTKGEFFTRVCESFKVEYVPVEIILEDVTEKFK